MPEIADGYCHCGCGVKTRIATKTDRGAGQIKGKPLRFAVGHNLRVARKPAKLDPDTAYEVKDYGYSTPCWVWQRGKVNGYGWLGSRRIFAHRFFYEREHGPIPAGRQLDHLCRNPACVNPEHLEIVTNAENTRRGACAKLTPAVVAQIRAFRGSHEAAGRAFGISGRHARAIRCGEAWTVP